MADKTIGEVLSVTVNDAVDFVKNQVVYLGTALGKTDGFDKVCRVAIVLIDLVGLTLGKSSDAQHLRGRIKNFRDIWIVCQVIQRVQEWTGTPTKDSMFVKDPNKSMLEHFAGVASKAIYGVGQFIESIKILGTWELVDLVALSERFVNGTSLQNLKGLPFISLVIDILYTSSAAILAAERFYAYMKGKVEKVTAESKLAKWTHLGNLFNSAFPKGDAAASETAMKQLWTIYEGKICKNQLKLQAATLAFTIATKKGTVLSSKNVLPIPENDTISSLKADGKALLAMLKEASQPDAVINKREILKAVDSYVRRLGAIKDPKGSLRRLNVQISNEVYALNQKLSEDNKVVKKPKVMKDSIKTINGLFEKVNREQRILYALRTGSPELDEYFEWKKNKWTYEIMKIDLKVKQALNMVVDMVLKVVGGVFSLFCHFNPIGKTFGSAVVVVMTDALRGQEFVRECIKVALGTVGGFFAYYAMYQTDKMEEQNKAFAARFKLDAKGKIARPDTIVSLKPLENPHAIEGGSLDDKRKLRKGEINQRVVDIVNLTDTIRCKRYKEELALRNGMLRIPAAA